MRNVLVVPRKQIMIYAEDIFEATKKHKWLNFLDLRILNIWTKHHKNLAAKTRKKTRNLTKTFVGVGSEPELCQPDPEEQQRRGRRHVSRLPGKDDVSNKLPVSELCILNITHPLRPPSPLNQQKESTKGGRKKVFFLN